MDLRLFGTLLIVLAGSDTTWSAPPDALIVKADASECQDKGEVLFCDYKSANQRPLYLENLNNSVVVKVFVYSALDLHVSDDACVDVEIHNAKGVTVFKSNNNECKRKNSLSSTKSEFKAIETKIGTVALDDCRVDKLTLDSELFELTIKKSEIKVLDVAGQTESGAAAIIQDSKIETLERLVINRGSKWEIKTSQIGKLSPHAVKIDDGILTITDSSIKEITENGLKLSEFQGSIALTRFSANEIESQQSDIFLVLFCLCLILLLISWIIFIVYLNKERILSSVAKRNANETGKKSDFELAGIATEQMTNNANTVTNKSNISKETEETEELLESKKDLPEQTKSKHLSTKLLGFADKMQTRGVMTNTRIQKIKVHQNALQEKLVVLKEKFSAFNSAAQGIGSNFEPYKKGDRKNHYSEFLEQLKSLLASVKTQYEECTNIYTEESEVSRLSKVIMGLAPLKTRQNHIQENTVMENAEESDNHFQGPIQFVDDIVESHEKELHNIMIMIAKPVKKSDLEKEASKYEWPPEFKDKSKLYSCLPSYLLNSILDELAEIEVKSLQHSLLLVNGNIQRVEKLLILMIDILISYSHVLLEGTDSQ